MNEFEYVGFWPRVGAALIDSLLLMLIIVPVSIMIWGDEYFLSDAFFLGPLDVVLNYVSWGLLGVLQPCLRFYMQE